MALSVSSPILKSSRMSNKASVLTIARLVGHLPEATSTENVGREERIPTDTVDNDSTITAIRVALPDKTVPGLDENGDAQARLRTSLPSYRRLCRTAGVQISSRSDRREASEPTTAAAVSKNHNIPVVSSHVSQTPNGVIAGYMSAMQHSISTGQDAGAHIPTLSANTTASSAQRSASSAHVAAPNVLTAAPGFLTAVPDVQKAVPSVEIVAPNGKGHLQQLRHHRSAVFEEIIKNSITTTLSMRVRASVADEVHLQYAHLLLEHERAPEYAHSLLKARGRRYWVAMYELQEMSSYYGGRQEAREAQLINEIYSRRDRAIATHFWALHHERMRYSEICFELSLPLGALLRWLLQVSA